MNLHSIISSLFCSKEDASNTCSKKDIKQQEISKDSSQKETSNAEIHNLIILDESGSMNCVRPQTILGCNKSLHSIRETAKKDQSISQYVSIYCFDSVKSRYVLRNVLATEVKDLTPEDYRPYGRTPLYDAIGYTVTQINREFGQQDSVGMVTIITDGYENDSRNWRLQDITKLIADLKEQGWTFTFIGANIDVKKMASVLGVDSFLQFTQSDEGMAKMFDTNRRSQQAYYEKLKRVMASEQYAKMMWMSARRSYLQ